MRSWESRGDTSVLDEPLYAAYLARTGLEHPGRDEILRSQPTETSQAIAALTAPCDTPVQYQKHMAHHVPDDADLGWMHPLQHVFLIRDPAAVLASYVRRRAQVAPEDLGFLQQWRLLTYVRDHLRQPVIVLDSADLLQDPRGELTRLCGSLKLPFDEAMLRWSPGPRPSDGVWAPHWYDAVWASTGFAAPKTETPKIDRSYQPVLDALLPVWDALRSAGAP
ncbi:MAG: HAD family hydrolase [Myxococcota bacterium]